MLLAKEFFEAAKTYKESSKEQKSEIVDILITMLQRTNMPFTNDMCIFFCVHIDLAYQLGVKEGQKCSLPEVQ